MIFPNVWELKKAARWRQKGNIMAKYLGGIDNPDIDVFDISKRFLSVDFDLKFYDYNSDSFALETISISDHIIRYEEITAEKKRSSDYSLTWGLTGYLTGGPLWGIVGAILGGSSTETENHVVFCKLDNGWQFAVHLDKDEFKAWKLCMDTSIKYNTQTEE